MNVIKKTKSKRLLSMLLILTMVLTLLPTVAFAGGSTPTVKIGGTTLESGKYYTVNTDGTLSEPADAKPTDGTGYAHWDGDNKALTLNNFDYTSPNQTDGGSFAIFISGGDCTIRMEGASTVKAGTATASGCESAAIYSDSTLIFEGEGELTAEGGEATGSYGVYAYGSNVKIKSGMLTAKGGVAAGSYGVLAQNGGKVEVLGGTLTATGGQATARSCGVESPGTGKSDGGIEVSGGTLTAEGGEATGSSYGVSTNGYISVENSGLLTAEGGEATVSSYGVYADGRDVKIKIKSGTLTATGGEAIVDSCGVAAHRETIEVLSGTLTATGGEATGSSYGVRVNNEGNVSVSNSGKLIAKSGNAEKNSYGVFTEFSSSKVEVSDSMLTATSGEARNGKSAGVYAGGVAVTNGTMTAEGGKAKSTSYGVYSSSSEINVTVSEGTLTATSGEAQLSCGVYSKANVTVSGGTLAAESGKGTQESCGVYSKTNVTVSGGTLTAVGAQAKGSFTGSTGEIILMGNSYGVNLGGDLTLEGGNLIAESGESNKGSYGVSVEKGSIGINNDSTLLSLGEITEGKQPTSGNYLYQKKDGNWTMNGSVPLPAGKTLSIDADKTLTVPVGGELTISDGAALDNKGKIDNEGTVNALSFTRDQLGIITGRGVVNCALSFADNTAYDVPAGPDGEPYEAATAFTAADGRTPHTFTIEPAVSGLSINNENKLVYARPTAHNAFTATVKVTDGANTSKTITIDIGAVTHAGVILVPENKATCTDDGNIKYYKCSGCKKLFKEEACNTEITNPDSVVIAAPGHDYETTWSSDAANHWHQCTRCGDKKDTAAHSFTVQQHDETNHWNKCATCPATDTKAAHTWNFPAATEEHDKHCTVCEYAAEAQLGHTHRGTPIPAKAATCTEAGNTAYYTCACGKWFSDASYNDEITNHGSVTIKALGHDHETTWSSDATDHWYKCTRCDDKKDTAAHTWNYDAATEEHDKHCTVCGYVAQAQLGHTHKGTLVPAKYPTFTERGNKAYYTCGCGKWFEDSACKAEIADHRSVVLAMLRYEITKGMDGEYTKGSGKALTFTANGPMNRCTGIRIDGTEPDKSCYTLESGSTIVTLTNAYLETLSEGKHEIRVVYSGDRDEAKADFTVLKAAQALPPKTSGSSDMLLWLALMLLSCGGAAAGRLCRKEETETE